MDSFFVDHMVGALAKLRRANIKQTDETKQAMEAVMSIEILVGGRIPPDNVEELRKTFTAHVVTETEDPDALIAEVGPRVRGLVVPGFRGFDRALLNKLPKVEMVSVWGAGISELDLDAARERNIVVTRTPDDSKVAVAELGLGLMLAAARWIPDSERVVRSGAWETDGYPRMGVGLAGRQCGIVALGVIGRFVAERAAAFGMSIAYFGPRRKVDVPYRFEPDLTTLAQQSDFLVLCCPDTPETRGLIDAEVLGALGPDGTLVNIARGPVVDEDALIEALEKGTIRAAALDVYANEPHVPERLRNSDRAVLVAHIGTQIQDVREKRKHFFIQNLQDHFAGRPIAQAARVLP